MFGNDVLFLQRLLKSSGFYTDALDGDFGPLTDAALRRFEDETDRIADDLGRFDLRSEKNIVTLQPQAQILARRFMAALPLTRNSLPLAWSQESSLALALTKNKPNLMRLVVQNRGKL